MARGLAKRKRANNGCGLTVKHKRGSKLSNPRGCTEKEGMKERKKDRETERGRESVGCPRIGVYKALLGSITKIECSLTCQSAQQTARYRVRYSRGSFYTTVGIGTRPRLVRILNRLARRLPGVVCNHRESCTSFTTMVISISYRDSFATWLFFTAVICDRSPRLGKTRDATSIFQISIKTFGVGATREKLYSCVRKKLASEKGGKKKENVHVSPA